VSRFARLYAVLVPLLLSCAARPALAAGPGIPAVENFANSIASFLIDNIGGIAILIGLAWSVLSYLMGDERAIRRLVGTVIVGGVLFAAPAIVDFIRGAAR